MTGTSTWKMIIITCTSQIPMIQGRAFLLSSKHVFQFFSVGARCVATLLHEMKKRGRDCRFGVISMCIGKLTFSLYVSHACAHLYTMQKIIPIVNCEQVLEWGQLLFLRVVIVLMSYAMPGKWMTFFYPRMLAWNSYFILTIFGHQIRNHNKVFFYGSDNVNHSSSV